MRSPEKQDLVKKAQALYLEGRYQEALTNYRESLVLNPDNPEAHCGLGEVLEALNRPGEALLAFERALQLDPLQAWAHFGRGGVLQGIRRYDEATKAYENAADLEPGEIAFHRVLGIIYYLQDRLQLSLKAYRRALEIEPQDTLSHYGVGLDLDALNRSDDAFFSYLRASRYDLDDPWPHLRLAGLLKRGVHPVGHSTLSDSAASLQSESMRPLARSSQAAIQKHLWQALILLEEKDHWGHAVLATLQGRPEAALRRVQQAVTLLPESVDWLRRDPDLQTLQADERFWLVLLSAQRRLG